jgi:tRNA nucleotidyltransferase (CCA-adding enzyme)
MSDLAALPFVRALQERGARVYTVGGTVRDTLLGHPRKDVDLLVTDVPQETLTRFLRRYGRVQLTGRAFGVIKFLPHRWHGPPIDIALPRTEVSTGIGHRDFVVSFDHTLPIEVDLSRRDFTINAMALDLANGHLIDPFGGRTDLAQRLLRQVSAAAFPEDPLRMLRGVQLATRFDLYVEARTREAMCVHAPAITTVAAERIAEELRKLFQATTPSRGFLLMREAGLLPYILPELDRLVGLPYRSGQTDAFTCTLRRLDALQQHEVVLHVGHVDLLLAALLQDIGLPETLQTLPKCPLSHIAELSAGLARQRLQALRMSTIGARSDRIEALIRHSAFDSHALEADAALRHFAHRVGPETVFMLFDLRLAERLGNFPFQPIDDLLTLRQRLRTQLDRQVPLRIKDLAINGHDLQRLGIPPGPRLGQILEALLQQVLDDPARNTRNHLLAVVQEKEGTWP